jgi:ketosteroid isomerase-like protein
VQTPEWTAQKEVAAANRRFYQAFERHDLPAMRAVWLDHAEARCVHPGGEMIVGTGRVLASWAAIFAGSERIRFDLTDLSVQVMGESACVCGIEEIRIRGEEGERASSAAVTNLFVRQEGDWKLLLHHASPITRRFFPEAP